MLLLCLCSPWRSCQICAPLSCLFFGRFLFFLHFFVLRLSRSSPTKQRNSPLPGFPVFYWLRVELQQHFFLLVFSPLFFRFSSVLCMLLLRSLLLPIYCMCVYFFEKNSDIFQCRVQSERAMRRVTKCEYFDARLENTFCDVSLSENFDNDHRTRLNVEAVFSPPAQRAVLCC